MIKNNELLIKIELLENIEKKIDLKVSYPLGKIIFQGKLTIKASHDDINYFDVNINNNSFDNYNYRYLKIVSSVNQTISIFIGLGYYCTLNEKMSNLFLHNHGWSGADGIYSFNLDNVEDYNQQNDRTLFVFGDSFIGSINEKNQRVEPTGFVNNTFGYLENGKIDFVVNRNDKGAYISLFEPSKSMQENGYLPKNLTSYYGDIYVRGYISSQDETKDIELIFDLYGDHKVNKIAIENFHDTISKGATNVNIGVQELDVLFSSDNENYTYFKTCKLDYYSIDNQLNNIEASFNARYIKFVIKRDRNVNDYHYVGLKKVYIYENKEQLFDIKVSSNSVFSYDEEKPYSWFWLQDGVIVDNNFYIFPCIIEQDKNGIEGFEFKIKGVAKLKMNIKDKKIDFKNVVMDEAPLYRKEKNREYILTSAIYSEDDYLYLYGYYNEQDLFLRHLIVSRILKDKIYDLNNLEYYDGTSWVKDMSKAISLLEHVSCEMSVMKIAAGENKGKYLAIFQYDTNGPKVAYSIGNTPWGPFENPRIVYFTPEVLTYNKTTYTYNAKAHLHLSKPKEIIVSYNCNDMSMKCNKDDYTIYHPRFINLIDTSNDEKL